jgi:hypothetical protein
MMMLEQGGAESDGSCAATKASRYTIDGRAGFELGSNDATRSIEASWTAWRCSPAEMRRSGAEQEVEVEGKWRATAAV